MGRTAGECIVLANKGRLSIQQLGSEFILSQTMLLALVGQNNTMRIKYFSSFWRYGKWRLEEVSNFFPWQP